jgi:ubiquinone/menaquinone biosynthesis C-methylase UbiE
MDFAGTEQDGELIIFSSIYKKYWEIGFKTRLYDWLSPEAYYDSLRRTAEAVRLPDKGWLLDAGCGSGILLPFLTDQIHIGGRYLGVDILHDGIDFLKLRADRLNFKGSASGVQADISRDLPVSDASISCVAAHFSVYTLRDEKNRKQVLQEFYRTLRPDGLLVITNPTHFYNAEGIIRSSLEQLQTQGRPWAFKKYVVYPLTLYLGLKYIERQLKSGQWYGYSPEELLEELECAGFAIEHSETVYGGSGFLVVGRKL